MFERTPAFSLVLMCGLPAAALAQDQTDDEVAIYDKLVSAGFEDPGILDGVEVARVTHDGETFFVLGGLDRMAQVGTQMNRDAAQAAPGDLVPEVVESVDNLPAHAEGQVQVENPDVLGTPTAPNPETTTGQADPLEPDSAEEPGAAESDDPAVTAQADPGEAAEQGTQAPAMMMSSLEDQLAEAGFGNYEILAEVTVAEVTLAESDRRTILVLSGIDSGAAE